MMPNGTVKCVQVVARPAAGEAPESVLLIGGGDRHHRAANRPKKPCGSRLIFSDLTHDAIFIRDAWNGVVRSWNRGAEALYGWTAEEAEGETVLGLLKTVFPIPLERISWRSCWSA